MKKNKSKAVPPSLFEPGAKDVDAPPVAVDAPPVATGAGGGDGASASDALPKVGGGQLEGADGAETPAAQPPADAAAADKAAEEEPAAKNGFAKKMWSF